MARIPIRVFIGVMVFFTTYITYSVTVNMAMSIVAMVKTKEKSIPECLEETHGDQANETKILPNYGPRYDWDEHDQGLILGSFFWGYTIFSFPGGTIAEKFGPATVIFYSSVFACLFNSLCVLAIKIHFMLLVVCRFTLGCCGGLQYPSLHTLIAKWAPPSERGKFLACMMGNTLATCLTWPMIGYVVTHWGWDWSFYVISMQQLVFSLIFYLVAADAPEKHRFISQEELQYIKESQGTSVSPLKKIAPFYEIFKSCPFWILTILHFGNLWGLYVQLQSVPKFMSEVIGFKIKQAGAIGALPHLTRLFCGIIFGIVGDNLKRNNYMTTIMIRKSFVLSSHIIPGILMIAIRFCGCSWKPVVILLSCSMALNGAVVLTSLQNPQDLAPNYAGTIFGIITSVGGTTGFMVPSLAAFFIHDHNGVEQWSYTFILGGSVYIITGIIFIFFGSVKEQHWNKILIEDIEE